MQPPSNVKLVLVVMLVLVAVGGIVLIGGDVVRIILNLMLGCPDFTDSQSGGAAMPSWNNFPPGLKCVYAVRLPDGTVGRHTDDPSWGSAIAFVAWVGWLATIVWVLTQLRGAAQLPSRKPLAMRQPQSGDSGRSM